MLARIDEIDGVEESRVDWTGRFFLVRLRESVRPQRVEPLILEILGENARRVPADLEQQCLSAYRQGEPWVRSGETLLLSLAKPEILAERFASRAGRESGLEEGASTRLREVLREEIGAAFESLDRGEGPRPGRLRAAWEAMLDRTAERVADFLAPPQREVVLKILRTGNPF